jgi:hypothetical protein
MNVNPRSTDRVAKRHVAACRSRQGKAQIEKLVIKLFADIAVLTELRKIDPMARDVQCHVAPHPVATSRGPVYMRVPGETALPPDFIENKIVKVVLLRVPRRMSDDYGAARDYIRKQLEVLLRDFKK